MARILQFALFLTVATLIVGGIHYYFWVRLVRDTALPPPWRTVGTIAIVCLAVGMPLSMLLNRALPLPVARVVSTPLYVWMGLMLLLLTALVFAEVPRLGVWLAARRGAIDPDRRLFLVRLLGGGAALAALGAAGFGLRNFLGRTPAVREVEIRLTRLPRALDGTTLVHISDIHVGAPVGRDFLERVVDRVNALRADVVCVVGDLVDGSVPRLRDSVSPIGRLRGRHGVFFVTGNHEYYSGAEAWIAELRRLGIRVLRNERVTIGEGEASFDLAGVDDWTARGMAPGHGPDLERALAGRDPDRAVVLLAHQPRQIHEAARRGVDLQLSGHTHGGQIWPWMHFVKLQQPFVSGLDREGATQIYTSNGTGVWGPPMRVGADAEITRITLRAGAA